MTAKGITLNEVKHAFTFLVSEDSDGAGFLSRDTATIAASQTIVVGQVLARQAGTGTATAVRAPLSGNTGNGVMTLASPAVDATVMGGEYRVVFIEGDTDGGTFEVFNPAGVPIGKGTVGVAFANGVKFTIADGSTDFVAGDGFSIKVNAGLSMGDTYVAWAPGLVADAIAGYAAKTGAGETAQIAVINAHATVRLADLTFGGSPTTAEQAQAMRDMEAKLIKFR